MAESVHSDDGAWRFKRYPKAPGTEALDGRLPAQALPAPPGDLESYASLAEVAKLISTKPGGRAGVHRVKWWLAEHRIPVQRHGHRGLVRKDLVLAALGKPAEKPAAELDINDWITLHEATVQLWGGKATQKRRLYTRQLLARHGIAVFRPRWGLTLVPKQAVLALVKELAAVKRLPRPRAKQPVRGAALEKMKAAKLRKAAQAAIPHVDASAAPTVRPGPAAEPNRSEAIKPFREAEIVRHRNIKDMPFTRSRGAL